MKLSKQAILVAPILHYTIINCISTIMKTFKYMKQIYQKIQQLYISVIVILSSKLRIIIYTICN